MEHQLSTRTVVGSGEAALVLELRGASVRIKRRGAPDLFVPIENASALAEFFRLAART